jgi:hypothetical protein
MAKDDIVNIGVESGVSAFDGKPFVNLLLKRVDGRTQSMQMRPAKAREIAVMLFEAAVEAERDAALVSGASEVGLDEETAGMLLAMIRSQREKWEETG